MTANILCSCCNRALSETEFYASRKNTCKECVKAKVRQQRADNVAHFRAYDRLRYRMDDQRKEQAKACGKSEAAKVAKKRYMKRLRDEDPARLKARNAVNNAIRTGKLERATSCFFCEKTSGLHAHHADYNRPLDVFWLCSACHGKVHVINGDFLKPVAV